VNSRSLPYLLIGPATLFLLVFFVYPFVQIALQAFQGPDGYTLETFQSMASDWKFPSTVLNTLLIAVIVVPLQLAMALTMASVVVRLSRGRDTILYIFAIPLGLSDLAAGLIWLAVFEQSGFLNSLLASLGIISRPILYLSYQNLPTIFVAIVIAELWRATAVVMVILVAGIGLIPREYYEAAEVFGASPWRRFLRITLPMLRPSLQTALILRTIAAFEVFSVVLALGGTNVPVLVYQAFNAQFNLHDENTAAAYALVILAISVTATLLYMRLLRVPKGARV
jgi:multiple sugar transport system permease protein